MDVERSEHGSMGCDVKALKPNFTAAMYGKFVGTNYGEGKIKEL